MPTARQDNTAERNKAIFRRYTRVIKRAKREYGDVFHHIPMIELYAETSIPFFIEPMIVGRIINKMLKDGYSFREDDVRNADIDEGIEEIANDQKK